MLFITFFFFLVSSLNVVADEYGKGYQKCYTISGWKYGNVGHLPTQTVTKTLRPTTIIVTRTRVTKTTTTPTTITTSVSTSTSTSTTTTTTTSISTTTIPAPAGFTPVYDSSGYTSLNAAAKNKAIVDTLLGKRAQSPVRYMKGDSKGHYGPAKPRYVKCIKTVQSTRTIFTTVRSTSTITAPTSTITSLTTTTTSSTTTTTTQTVSTTTFYAACATNNILGPRVNPSGQFVQGVGNSDPNGIQQNIMDVASPYDCCVICLTGSTGIENCQNSIYDADTQVCNVIGGDPAVCGPGGTQGDIGSYVLLTTLPMNRFDSNGPCGVLGPDPAV